jgi:hypothetical protein
MVPPARPAPAAASEDPPPETSRRGGTPPERLFDALGTTGTVGTMVPVGEGAA